MIGIVYGSSMGNTEDAAKLISEGLGLENELLNVSDVDAAKLNGFDKLILGTSTWGSGDLQDDWDAFDFKGLKFVAKEPKMAAAKMIKMLYKSGEFEFFIDAAQMFCQFVYDKIRLRHQDKEVVLNGGVISVKKGGKNLLSVMPSFKRVSFDDMRNLNDDIDRAVCALGSECEMVYIVCPRNEEFRRHVEVRHCFARGCIKLVPYTIISKIF